MTRTLHCPRCSGDRPEPEWHPSEWAKGAGWCKPCRREYMRARYTPKPPQVREPKPTPPPREPSTTYDAIHSRLKKTHGSATQHTCPCGQPAEQWAYDHTDPAPLTQIRNNRTVTYSPDLNRYQPMCSPCHWKLDHPTEAAKTHCPQGHEYAGHNLVIKRGRRTCRTCENAYQRNRSHKTEKSPHSDPEPLAHTRW